MFHRQLHKAMPIKNSWQTGFCDAHSSAAGKFHGDFYKRDTCKSIFPAIGFEPTSERDRFIKDRTIMPAPAQDEMGIL